MRQLSRSKKNIYKCQGRSIYKKSLYTTPFYVYIYTEFQIHENLLTITSNITSMYLCIRMLASLFNIKTSKYFANRGSFISNSSSLNFRMLMGAYCVYIVPLQYRTITHPSRVYSINPNFKYPLPPPFDKKIPTILRFIWYEIY